MTSVQRATGPAARPKFDNHGQYSRTGILRYEMVFGEGYVSTGGVETTLDLCARLGSALRPGVRVLDVGSGIGGAAFHLASSHGAHVTGIDLAEEMVNIAVERAASRGLDRSVTFVLGDVLETSFPEPFDVIWSRDAFMHIPDKPRLFATLYRLLGDGGKLVITDYARGRSKASPEFESYIESTGYSVVEPREYGRLLEEAGFVQVVADDKTARFVEILEREMSELKANPGAFLAHFTQQDLDYLIERWAMKIRFCAANDMKWGNYLATKPGESIRA